MTDDNNPRYRSGDPYGQQPHSDDHGNDPLAELARLIGQSDAFHQHAARAAEPHDDRGYEEPRAYHDRSGHDDRAAYNDPSAYDVAGYRDEPPVERAAEEHRYDAPFEHQPAFGRDAPQEPAWPEASDPTLDRLLAAVRTNPPADPVHDDRPEASPARPSPVLAEPALHASPLFNMDRAEPAPRSLSGFAAAPLSEPGRMPPPNPDEFYDDAPSGGRRRGMVTVFAVLALAVLGTGAAFGYRTWFGGPTVKSPPPVVRASAEPNKIAPPPQANPKEASKITYDRFADRGQNEQIVVREEKPVNVSEIARSGPPRPNVAAPAAAPAVAAPPSAPAANPPSVLTEPKRVRTVPIRPDAPDAAVARPPQMAAALPPPPAQRSVAPQRQASAGPNAPLDLANPQPQARAAAPTPAPALPAPPVRTAARPEPPPGTAPLSLAAENGAAPARAAAPRPAANGNGSFLVQVSSQRSEADAQAAFRSIKSKYAGVLGSHQPVIRRAELAGKGTYYRAMVGPFASRGEAVQLCSSLKAAGGDCVVQAN